VKHIGAVVKRQISKKIDKTDTVVLRADIPVKKGKKHLMMYCKIEMIRSKRYKI
jgi:hypothetical protein